MDAKEKRRLIDEHFKEYNDICNQIEEQRCKWTELNNKLYGIKPINYSGMPSGCGGGSEDKVIEFLERLDDIEKDIGVLRKERKQKKEEHLKEINCLENLVSRRIIREIYLNRHKVEDLMKLMNYNRSSVFRLKNIAIDEFANLILEWTNSDKKELENMVK